MIPTAHFTDYMRTLFDNSTSGLQSFYSREDFARAIAVYRDARADSRPFRFQELERMCKGRKLDPEALLADPGLLEDIPTHAQLQELLLETFHALYRQVPGPAAYMQRLVQRLAPEYAGDPVRVAILKKFVLGGGREWKTYPTGAILDWAEARLCPAERALPPQERLPLAVDKLDDSLFQTRLDAGKLTDGEIMALIRRRWEKLPGMEIVSTDPEREEAFRQTLEALCHGLGLEAPMQIGPMLEALTGQALPLGSAAAAEKAFKNYLSGLRYRSKGKIRSGQELFKTDVRDAKAAKSEMWKLLPLCDDLAEGRFKTNDGKTRANLYHFAMLFGMSVTLDALDPYDPERDLVKNLFQDYYCDNLIRYLSAEGREGPGSGEREPGGEGINFKNFAEIIYLYYIYRQDLPLSPGKRVDRAEQMIQKCIDRHKSKKFTPAQDMPEESAMTGEYRNRFLHRIASAPEERLVELVLANCHMEEGGSRMQYAAHTNAAARLLQETMVDIETGSEYAGAPPEELDEGCGDEALTDALLQDARDATAFRFVWRLTPMLLEKYAREPDFCRLVRQIDERLTAEIRFISVKKINLLSNLLHLLYILSDGEHFVRLDTLRDALREKDVTVTGDMVCEYAQLLEKMGFDVQRQVVSGESRFCLGRRSYDDAALNEIISRVKNRYYINEVLLQTLIGPLLEQTTMRKRRVTRTTLIAAYTAVYTPLLHDTYEMYTFPDLCEDFAASVDPILQEARYQPIHEKNVLDLYVLLSLYFYMLEND